MSAIQQVVASLAGSTNTYATWDPANKSATISLSGGNLIATVGTTGNASVKATIGKSSGKWYWEAKWSSVVAGPTIGLASSGSPLGAWPGANSTSWGWDCGGAGDIYNGGVAVLTAGTFTSSDTLGFALDMSANTLAFYKNNTLLQTATVGAGTWYPTVGQSGTNNASVTMNFGASAMTYTAPSGFNQGLY